MQAWDDVNEKMRVLDDTSQYRKKVVLESRKSEKSLMEYEDIYRQENQPQAQVSPDLQWNALIVDVPIHTSTCLCRYIYTDARAHTHTRIYHFTVFDTTRPRNEPPTYRTRGGRLTH